LRKGPGTHFIKMSVHVASSRPISEWQSYNMYSTYAKYQLTVASCCAVKRNSRRRSWFVSLSYYLSTL